MEEYVGGWQAISYPATGTAARCLGDPVWRLNAMREQVAYAAARVPYDALDRQREQMLASVDAGEPLSPADRIALEQMQKPLLATYQRVLEREEPLLQATRAYIQAHPEILATAPAYTALLEEGVAGSRRAYALDLSLCLVPREGH